MLGRNTKSNHGKRFLQFVTVLIFFLLGFKYIFHVFIDPKIFYSNSYKKWSNLSCKNNVGCIKLLLVADPQITGIQNEPWYLQWFTITDNDDYLKNGYSVALEFIQPDVVIFLGDLLDEGSIATDEEFKKYAERFYKIFPITTERIYVPGDNDIGGEGTDLVKDSNIERFNYYFPLKELCTTSNQIFFVINTMTNKILKFLQQEECNFTDSTKRNEPFIGLSHVPLMFEPSEFSYEVLSRKQPQLLFSGHKHEFMILQKNVWKDNISILHSDVFPSGRIYTYNLDEYSTYEIIVPTCSYRMGKTYMGYGFAKIEENKLVFTVLWLPSRYDTIVIFGTTFLILVIITMWFLLRWICSNRKNYIRKFWKKYEIVPPV